MKDSIQPIEWPANLRRPRTDEVAKKVIECTASGGDELITRLYGKNTFQNLRRKIAGLIYSRVCGMSSPEIARLCGYKAHSSFVDSGTWHAKFVRSDAGTAMYNEIVRQLINVVRGSHVEIYRRADDRD